MLDYELDFEFNGIHSSTFGVSKITMTSGMQSEDYYLANKTINGFRLRDELQTHLTNIDKEPLVIPMTIYLNGNVDFERETRIKEWLETDKYCKLKFGDQIISYNAMLQGNVKLTHDSIGDGYIDVVFLTDSPYRFSDNPFVVSGEIKSPNDFVKVPLSNYGSLTIRPTIKIKSPGVSNGIEIRNVTTGEYFNLKGTYTDLTLNIINQAEELDTEGNFTNLYENHNGQFISLKKGRNDLEMKGSFYYEISYKYVYL